MTSQRRSSPGRLFPINIQYPHFFSEGPEGGLPIPFPSPYFFQIPLPSAQIPFWSRLRGFQNIYPIAILKFFSHSQRPNPSPSALNLIFPGQYKANPSSHFTPLEPSSHSCNRRSTIDIRSSQQQFLKWMYKH